MPIAEAKVLIVDDEANIRQSLRGVLSDENYNCTAVDTGEACLAMIESDIYDAVLLDIWLPGMDGLDNPRKDSGNSAGSAASGHHDFRSRKHRDRGKGHQAWRI